MPRHDGHGVEVMATAAQLEAMIKQLSHAVEELRAERRTNGWSESAKMVLTEIKRQGAAQERHEEQLRGIQNDMLTRLSSIQLAIVSASNDTHGMTTTLEQRIKSVSDSIGTSPACREHSRALTKLEERVDQHATQQRERLKRLGDIWTEINKLRDWVKAVNDAGLIDQTEGRVRWPIVGAVGAFGGFGGWGIVELALAIMRGL